MDTDERHERRTRQGDGADVPGAPGRRDEAGFALAVALLTILGLTALATGGLLLSRSEGKVSVSHQASVNAYYSAEAALEDYLGTHSGPPDEPVSYDFGEQGSATVSGVRLRTQTERREIYLLRAEGEHVLPSGAVATRRIYRVALMDGETFDLPSSFTSLSGIHKDGGSGELSGYDAAAPGECPTAGNDVAGVSVPNGGYTQDGGQSVPEGEPPIAEDDPDSLAESLNIDWEGMVNRTSITPDYTVPPDDWPDFSALGPEEYPTIYIDGDYSLGPGHSGRGMIVATGDLTFNGGFDWNGPILAGGSVTSNGQQQIQGGVIAGLNTLLGQTVDEVTIGNGFKSFRYNSCEVLEAQRSSAPLVAEPGTAFEPLEELN